MLYIQDDPSGIEHLMITTLEIVTPVLAEPVGDPEDNTVVAIVDQEVSDGSGTVVEVPEDTTITFPPEAPQEIQIETPISPASEPEIPAGVEGIPVIREFGPDGTAFDPPIVITITYTDAEIGDADESMLRVFLYNEVSGIYDIEVADPGLPLPEPPPSPPYITARDIENNEISFVVDHFSTYGIATVTDVVPPTLTVEAFPDTLWPPNHKMVEIQVSITVTDDKDPDPEVRLVGITVDDDERGHPRGPGHHGKHGPGRHGKHGHKDWHRPHHGCPHGHHGHCDIRVDADGRIFLRAERGGKGADRTYTITYEATDASGNTSEASATVVVPHDSHGHGPGPKGPHGPGPKGPHGPGPKGPHGGGPKGPHGGHHK